MNKLFISLFCLFHFCGPVFSQSCNTPGQTPSTAFPVCGTSVFQQTTVPICTSHNLKVPGCGNDGAAYQDKNPFWYKFTCFQSGSLGFLISPKDQGDDYDWQLYDITGRNPDDVFTDASLVVTGNWAGTYGNTGASSSGVNFIQCASDPNDRKNSFSNMPNLIKGHTYLLLVSHFTDSQSGYSLSFGGGSAVITDTTQPRLKAAEANCGGDQITLKINKKIKCSSIAADGSDFYIEGTSVTVANSSGVDCSSHFDTDSLQLKLSAPLAPGNYTLHVKDGSDGNTLLDYCDNGIATTNTISFTILPQQPTPMDSMEAVTCAPQQIKLLFKKPMLCSSIAADGSDFSITGTYPVSITGATGACSNNTTKEIKLLLSQPLLQQGQFTITLKKGSDGSTVINECSQETLPATLQFSVKDTVNAAFTAVVNYGCAVDTVHFNYPRHNGVTHWRWSLDEGQFSTQQNPTGYYRNFNTKTVQLAVSNGFCSDTVSTTVALDNYLKADFAVDPDICPKEPIPFTSAAVGKVVSHLWSFGDGSTDGTEAPSHIYAQPDRETVYTVRYTVTDSYGCQQTATRQVHVYSSCYIDVPNAFTPNGDGRNDFFYPLNAVKAQQLQFRVYNRWGQLVFETGNWKQGWDGTFRNEKQAAGVYIWMMKYTDGISHKVVERKGTVMLIR